MVVQTVEPINPVTRGTGALQSYIVDNEEQPETTLGVKQALARMALSVWRKFGWSRSSTRDPFGFGIAPVSWLC